MNYRSIEICIYHPGSTIQPYMELQVLLLFKKLAVLRTTHVTTTEASQSVALELFEAARDVAVLHEHQ
jgi:hypothetical protein